MILILSQSGGNSNARLVEMSCIELGVSHAVLNVDTYGHTTNTSLEFSNDQVVCKLGSEVIHPTAIFNCGYDRIGRDAVGLVAERYQQFVSDELLGALYGSLCSMPSVLWMNSPQSVYLANLKLYQLSVARAVGLTIPATVVSNQADPLLSFWNHHRDTGTVTKAIRVGCIASHKNKHTVMFTNRVKSEHVAQLPPTSIPPILFQEEISKKRELRVVVVGSSVFSCVVGNAGNGIIDWRTDKNATKSSERVILPKRIQDACVEIVKRLGLSLGAIDLIEGKDGLYYFLEVNQQGGWIWMETELGMPISKEIVRFLDK